MIALVTGGASCGKSALSEKLCMNLGDNRIYLAAMRPFGSEGEQRVRKHRAQRAGKGFTTIECFDGFGQAVSDERIIGAAVLLECLGNVVANELFSDESSQVEHDAYESERARGCVERVDTAMRMLEDRAAHVVVVGNEVGSDGVAYQQETREYQRVLGVLSCNVAHRSDLVVECVAGEPKVLKARTSGQLPGNIVRVMGLQNGGGHGSLT